MQYDMFISYARKDNASTSARILKKFDGTSTQQGVSLPLVRDAWVELRYEIDLDADSVGAYYNNTLLGTLALALRSRQQNPWVSGGSWRLGSVDHS